MRGRLLTCGRLVIGLPAAIIIPENAHTASGLPPCGAAYSRLSPFPLAVDTMRTLYRYLRPRLSPGGRTRHRTGNLNRIWKLVAIELALAI